MKNFIRNAVIILILAMVILGSYEKTSPVFQTTKLVSNIDFNKQKQGLTDFFATIREQSKEVVPKEKPSLPSLPSFKNIKIAKKLEESDFKNLFKNRTKKEEDVDFSEYRAVWISYQEFNSYRISSEENNATNFRRFFQSVLERCQNLQFNTVIVQVRPFGDALYDSKYFPWAACISGAKGENPGYDPLKIMVKEAHKKNMHIEAWINPYRIATDTNVDVLPENDPAKRWVTSEEESRNVLTYDGGMYYNPSSEKVRNLIANGVEEIVKNYDVDGIHMDDYFYPQFEKMNFEKCFDAKEYKEYKKNNVNKKTISIANWRRNNVNELVSTIYKKCHIRGVVFGISPAGNLDNLRSDYGNYVDIDRWMHKKGYVDYIIPQIYWGFTNEKAPFKAVLSRWDALTKNSHVKLYVGLPLYKVGSSDVDESEYQELQSGDFLQNQVKEVEKDSIAQGFSVFSYQYMDLENENYSLEPSWINPKQKKLLKKNIEFLQK